MHWSCIFKSFPSSNWIKDANDKTDCITWESRMFLKYHRNFKLHGSITNSCMYRILVDRKATQLPFKIIGRFVSNTCLFKALHCLEQIIILLQLSCIWTLQYVTKQLSKIFAYSMTMVEEMKIYWYSVNINTVKVIS